MANQTVTQGSFTINSGADRSIWDLSSNVTLVGTNNVQKSSFITASGYTALDTASLSSIRQIYVYNPSTSSIVVVASDNAGANKLTVLWPDDATLINWSGSTQLWAKIVSGSVLPTTFQYALVEK